MQLQPIKPREQREPMRRYRLPLIKRQTSPAATDATLELGRFRGLSRQPQLLADSVPVELGTRAFDLLMVLIEAVSKPILPKTPVWKAVGFATGLGLAMLSFPVHAAPASGGDTVQGLYDVLLSTMKNGRTLGQSGRFAQLEPVIRRTFDIPSMARLSVGSSWATLTEAQRQQVTESFGRYISAIYADRFDSYDGQKLQVTGEQPAAAGAMVRSQIIKANGEPVNVDYMMRRTGDTWLISDIYLDGAISEVATRRSEFAAILKNEGIDGLSTALNRKADILTGTTAKAF
jgi:phospholipid transport system substrate-binding protein